MIKKTIIGIVGIQEDFDNENAPLAKINLKLSEMFTVEVSIWDNNYGDKFGAYPPYAMFPFQYSYEVEYEDKEGNKKSYKDTGYNMKFNPHGDEETTNIESKNIWEDIRHAVTAEYLRYLGKYDIYKDRHVRRRKSKNNFSSRGCDTCRFREMELQAQENETGKTENHYRHTCALTEDTIDDGLVKFYENDQLEDKGLLSKLAKGIKVNKHGILEDDYRIKCYSNDRIRDNHLKDEGYGCPYHHWFSNFSGNKGDFFVERLNPILPENDDHEVILPYGIVLDASLLFEEREDPVDQDDGNLKNLLDNEMVNERKELTDEQASTVALCVGKKNKLEGDKLEDFINMYVNLA